MSYIRYLLFLTLVVLWPLAASAQPLFHYEHDWTVTVGGHLYGMREVVQTPGDFRRTQIWIGGYLFHTSIRLNHLCGGAQPARAEDKVPFSVLKDWYEARVKQPTVVVLTDEVAYAKLFTESFAEFHFPKPVVEKVDFKSKQVIAVCWGARNSTGYSISLVSVIGTPKETTITVKTTVPKGLAEPEVTYPAVVLVIPKTESVRVVVTGDRLPSGWSDFTDLKKGLEVKVAPPAAEPKDKEPTKDVERLQGDWVMVEYGSIKYKEGQPDQLHFNLYIKKDRAIIHFDGTDPDDEIMTTFTVDSSKTPKEIDFVGVSSTITGFKKGTQYLGIYKLDGDTLTLCWAGQDEKKRPTEFKHKPDEEVRTYKFIRSKKPISGDSTRVNERPK